MTRHRMRYEQVVDTLKRFLPVGLRRLIGRVLVEKWRTAARPLTKQSLQEGILSALALRSRGSPEASEAALARVFNSDLSGHPGLSGEYVGEFLAAVEQRRSFVLTGDSHHMLLERTRALDASLLPCQRWLLLHGACVRNGLFRVAGAARDKATEAAYLEVSARTAGVGSLVEALKAAIDQGDFEKAGEFLNRLRSVDPQNSLMDDLQQYYDLNRGDRQGLQSLNRDRLMKEDLAFAEYVNGRSLAIVGPAPSGEDLGLEIDSFDIVARISYRGGQFLPAANEFGARVDVSYYGMAVASQIEALEEHAFFGDLRFALFKSLEHAFQKRLLQSQRGRLFNRNRLFLDGSPTEVQNALFDLFHFQPRRVKLFHVNLFLAKTSHHTGYHIESAEQEAWEDAARKILDSWVGLAHHGLVNQLSFTRNLWKAGLIEADRCCEDVLRLTPAEYLAAMEEVYVIAPIKEYAEHRSVPSG